jgi:hypothetical protein
MVKYYIGGIFKLSKNEIFVFGSNLAGRHGKGAALTARSKYGAEYGVGSGSTGRCYAIPTKDRNLNTLSLDYIQDQINTFKQVANYNSTYNFMVTKVGCGLAGYLDYEIAPLFKESPSNCFFSTDWQNYLEN